MGWRDLGELECFHLFFGVHGGLVVFVLENINFNETKVARYMNDCSERYLTVESLDERVHVCRSAREK